MNWQPIESAPRDGTAVLVTDGYEVVIARWRGRRWEHDDCHICGPYEITPDFWMPQPPLPDEPRYTITAKGREMLREAE